jgi:integrase
MVGGGALMGKHAYRCHGITKRCECGHRQWTKCAHPWHFHMKWQGHEFRFQLNEAAHKPPGYAMLKTEAESLRDGFRSQIRAGIFRHPKQGPTPTGPSAPDPRLTVSGVMAEYLKRHVRMPNRRPQGVKQMEYNVRTAERVLVPAANGRTVRFGDKVFSEVIKADIDALLEPLQTRLPRAKGGHVGSNRILRRLRHLWNWAIAEGFTDSTPFKRHGVPVIRMNGEAESPRHRRLEGDEETRLLAVAPQWLQDLIVAALETGCRKGELLSLQWKQLRWEENVLLLPSVKTKTGEARGVPITKRLREVLQRRCGCDTDKVPADAYAFGNEVGERRLWIHDAWKAACLKAGIVDLHFHDLRRECGSRLIETPGVAVHDVSAWLGHSNIITTSRYLSMSDARKHFVLERFEAARAAVDSRVGGGA